MDYACIHVFEYEISQQKKTHNLLSMKKSVTVLTQMCRLLTAMFIFRLYAL